MDKWTSFYVTGGTLSANASCYIERHADRELLEALLNHELCYVLTARQLGKSSLMVRTAQKLRQAGVHVASLDLTACGSNLTAEQWYQGLLVQLGQQLHLEDELEAFWSARAYVGPCQRFFICITECILPLLLERVGAALPAKDRGTELEATVARWSSLVIFVDELDMVQSLPFNPDEFFGAIRESHNRRSRMADLDRVTFCLLGVATPGDLVRDTRVSPFNIGRPIVLQDFTRPEIGPLGAGLEADGQTEPLLDRVYDWTCGHPYLTLKLCRMVARRNRECRGGHRGAEGVKAVDRLCTELFLNRAAREQDDNLTFVRDRLLRSSVDRSRLLRLYREVRSGKRVMNDTSDPAITALLLSGVILGEEDGYLQVRNRVYQRAFDLPWVRENLPEAAQREERRAYWRGIRRATTWSLVVLVVLLGVAVQQTRLARAQAQRHLNLLQLDAFFELSDELFAIANAEGRFTKLNQHWEVVLGYSRAELCSRPYVEFVHPDDREGTHQVTKHLEEGMTVSDFTNRYRRADGQYVTLVWRATTDPKSGRVCATARVLP